MATTIKEPVIATPEELKKKLKEVVKGINDFIVAPPLYGKLVTDLDVSTSALTVKHGLRRVPVGWIVVRKDATADIWEDSEPTAEDLVLIADASATIAVWVF